MCLIATAMVSLEFRSLTEVLIFHSQLMALFRKVCNGARRGDLAAAEDQRSGCGQSTKNQRRVESHTASRGEVYRMRVEQVERFIKLLVLAFMTTHSRSSICLCIAFR